MGPEDNLTPAEQDRLLGKMQGYIDHPDVLVGDTWPDDDFTTIDDIEADYTLEDAMGEVQDTDF